MSEASGGSDDDDEATQVESRGAPAPHDSTTLAGRYELLGFLGSGGMGTVYRARDRELDEVVAIKVLRREIAQNARDLERFRREVKLARKVTHRNVVRTFDIGHDGGDRFLTMQYVDGAPLAALLQSASRWPADQVIALARELCEGLHASHEAGVLHGDLKPQNVIVTASGRPVITDFGIARALVQESDHDDESTDGTLIGTPTYMAPEQVEGARDLDARADVYALGCMLFRALTGYAPWKGGSSVATAVMRLVHPPPDPRTVVADVPAALAEAVLRCMARERDARFASMEELLDGLREMERGRGGERGRGRGGERGRESERERESESEGERGRAMRGAAAPAAPRTVAVLRLADDGTDESAYLARAVADELVELLAAVPRLRVTAGVNRSRSAAPSVGARDAGRALGADVVVTGELVREQDIVHVTLGAVTVDDGFRLWTRSFSSPLTEILQRTHDAAASVAKIFEPNDVEIATRPAPDAGALDLYLRGRHLYATSFFDVDAAIEAFAEAHQRAPSDGRIAAAYALALMRRHMLFPMGRADAEQVRRLAGQALASIPGLAAPHVVLAALHYDDGEHRSTALELRRALDAEPNNADALDLLGILLLEGGQPGRAIETLRRAMQADPSRATLDATLARAYELIGDSATADELVGGFRPPARDATRVWLARARLAVWRRDPAAAQRWLEVLAVSPSLPQVAHERVVRTLRVARDRDPALAAEAYLDPAPALARRAAFVMQINVELLVAVGQVALAEQKLGELETLPFFDLTWLDACPLLAELRGSQTFAVLRRSTAARVARALEAL